MSVEAAVAEVVTTLNLSADSSQKNAAFDSVEPRSITNPPSFDAVEPEAAPLDRLIRLSLTSKFVVETVVVVPDTVRFPLRVKSAAERLPEKEAELPSEASDPVAVCNAEMSLSLLETLL